MSDQETISHLLQTNRIHDKLRNILDFFINAEYDEDILELENSIVLYVSTENAGYMNSENCIGILNRKDGNIRIRVINFGTNNEWEDISFSGGGSNPYIREILYNLPSLEARKLCTDSLIKEVVSKKFYNFLININIDLIKSKLV